MDKKVKIQFNKKELSHLINDLIDQIWKIKQIVFGENWNFGTDITEVDVLTPQQENDLKLFGYYSRKELLDKLKKIELENFFEAYCEVTNNE